MTRKRVDDIEPAPAVEFKRAPAQGKATRVMSASMIAAMFCVRRDVVLTWKRDGCPVEKEASKKGESDQFDLADVINWRLAVTESRAIGLATEAAAMPAIPGTASDGKESKEQADTRRARSQANISEIEEAEAAGAVVPVDAVLTMVSGDYARVRQGLEGLGSKLADRTAPITDPAKVKEMADEMVRDAVEHLIPRMPGEAGEDDDDLAA